MLVAAPRVCDNNGQKKRRQDDILTLQKPAPKTRVVGTSSKQCPHIRGWRDRSAACNEGLWVWPKQDVIERRREARRSQDDARKPK